MGVSWLPLYHDMGLIGFVLVTVVHGVNTVFIPTSASCDAWVWLDAMHRHRGTISFAPNFAYALAARRVRGAAGPLDLSCVKSPGCGAEPIHPDTLRQFTSLYAQRCGLQALTPAYGLAESTPVSASSPWGPLPRLEVDAEAFGSRRGDHPGPGGRQQRLSRVLRAGV